MMVGKKGSVWRRWTTATAAATATVAVALAVASVAAAQASAAESPPSPFGVWFTASRKAAIETYPCGERGLCGKIVWMVDDTQRLCNLEILRGFVPDDDGAWRDGVILDPRDGERWQAVISPAADGVLRVRGFVLAPLFGQTQTWTKVPAEFGARCQSATAR